MRKHMFAIRAAMRTWKSALLSLLLLLGCTPTPSPIPASPIPYATRTPTPPPPTATLLPTPSQPPPPLPSPTPASYTIRSGDTLEGLAKRFNLTVDDLLLANPGLTSLLQPGQVISIPAPRAQTAPATPTPAPLRMASPACYPRPDQTQTCFFVLENPGAETLENVAIQVAFAEGDSVRTRLLFLPLDILPPHSRMPAFDTFPIFAQGNAFEVYVLSALRLSPDDPRYLPATLHRLQIVIAPSERFASVSGEVYLPPSSAAASLIWIAATAYDSLDRAVGFRRWEANTPLAPGEHLPFQFSLGSFAPMARVELLVEARR